MSPLWGDYMVEDIITVCWTRLICYSIPLTPPLNTEASFPFDQGRNQLQGAYSQPAWTYLMPSFYSCSSRGKSWDPTMVGLVDFHGPTWSIPVNKAIVWIWWDKWNLWERKSKHLGDYELNSENTVLPSRGRRTCIHRSSHHLSFPMVYIGLQWSLVSALVSCFAAVINCLAKATQGRKGSTQPAFPFRSVSCPSP